jgi:hypothetical protein
MVVQKRSLIFKKNVMEKNKSEENGRYNEKANVKDGKRTNGERGN